MRSTPAFRLAIPQLVVFACACLLTACSTTAKPPTSPQQPKVDTQRVLQVGFVVVDGVYNTELTAPWDVFQHVQFHAPYGMQVLLVAPDDQPIKTFEGLRLLPDHTFADCPELDVLVVPSAEYSMTTDLDNEELIGFVRDRGGRAAYVISLCDGAFVLAQSGLLDGREATTFPADLEAFSRRFGTSVAEVVQGVSFVHDGPMITSAGGAPSFDPALYLCELLYGRTAALGVAEGLIINWNLKSLGHRVVVAD